MDVKKLINREIVKSYSSKKEYCESLGFSDKDLTRRLNGIKNRIEVINNYISPLGLQIKIVKKYD